jgi:translation initiation factor 4G
MISTVTNFLAFFLRKWILFFHLEDSITPNRPTVVPAAPRLQPDLQPGSPVSLEAHPKPDDRMLPDSLFPQWAVRCFKWNGPISPNFTIAADPHLLLPVTQLGSSKDTHDHLVSIEQDPTGITQTHPTVTSVTRILHNEQHLKVQLDREQADKPDHHVVNGLQQRLVATSLARDSLRVKNNQLKKFYVRMQQKHQQEMDDLKRSHRELVSVLTQAKLENELLSYQQAQMKRENEIKISELEKNCSRLMNEKEDLVIKLIQAESDVKSLSSSLENQKETVCELENVISDLQSKKTRVPNVAFSQGTQTDTSTILSCLPRTYDRAFLIQRKPFGIMKPQCLPSEIARKVPMGMNSSKVTPPRRQIKLFDIKPSERVVDTSNAWKPKRATPTAPTVTSATDVLLSTVRGILNKMTPSKHEQFLAKILALEINDEEKLSGVIQLFFEKALDEPMYAATYAQMCQSLSTKQVVSSTDPTESLSFRTLLLSRCQKVFQKDSDILIDVDNKRKEIQKAETKEKKTILETELISLIDRNRRTTLGNIKFIGELYKVGNITENVMHNCIRRLLQAPDEEAIESLCRLLTTRMKTPL